MGECPWEINCSELQERLASDAPPLVVDCREPDEHAVAAIPGALLLPMSQWEDKQRELEPHCGRPIVVYCHFGMRSQKVAAWLREKGFDAVQSLAGDIDALAAEVEPG